MITKYTTWYGIKIEKVEVLRETEKMVVLRRSAHSTKEHKEMKRSANGENYFDSWDEAHQFLIDKCRRKIDVNKNQLQATRSLLGQIKSMRDPENMGKSQ